MSAKSLSLKWHNYHHIGDIKRLKGSTELLKLNLEGNYIKYITDLDHLTKLNTLNLSLNGICEISGLEKLTQLKVLKIASPQNYYEPPDLYDADVWDRDYFELITKIEGLKNLTKLEVLDLSRNKIEKIEGLDSLVNLKTLNLSGNPIKKIEGLEHQQKLEKLYLLGCRIQSVPGLKHLKNLKELSFGYNPLEAISNRTAKHLVNLKRCDVPIQKTLKVEKINDILSVKWIHKDYSRWGQFRDNRWSFYPKWETKQMSCLLAVIYVKTKAFKRECPRGPERKKVHRGGLRTENEQEFIDYCTDLKKWADGGYKDKIFPKHMTKPLREMINASDKKISK